MSSSVKQVNRINDKVSLASTMVTNDVGWNNEEILEGKDMSKRKVTHFSDGSGRVSTLDGHNFAYSSSIIIDYANWEANDYVDQGFFDPKASASANDDDGLFLIIMYWIETIVNRLTLFFLKPLALLLSRRVSGIKSGNTVSTVQVSGGLFGETKVNYKPHGYFGWGKIMMISPDTVVDTLQQELTNLSLVAALMLTITLPLVCCPGNDIASKNYSWLYITIGSASVAGQFTTVTSSLAIITNLNKTKVIKGRSGMLFVKSIFNPYYGLTGLIGPFLYLGAIFSWCSTVVMSIVLLCASYESMNIY